MQCSKETLAWLFYNSSSSFFLLLLIFYFSSILLAKLFYFLCTYPIIQRSQNGYEAAGLFSEEEEEEEGEEEEAKEEDGNRYFYVESMEREHLVADIICGGESLLFLPTKNTQKDHLHDEDMIYSQDPIVEDQYENFDTDEQFSVHDDYESSLPSESEEDEKFDVEDQEIPTRDTYSVDVNSDQDDEDGPPDSSPIIIKPNKSCMVEDDQNYDVAEDNEKMTKVENMKSETNFTKDQKFLIFSPPQLETKKFQVQDQKDDNEEIFGDSCTNGSTSKSSSDWRSSINYRDSGTEDPFSSSSRRSCPKWESYTVFQKYDEEMMFLDRISAQKLHETESFKSFQVCPRSISERIVHKLATINKKPSLEKLRQNPYHELEGAYVAQMCLAWEALNWNYKKFQHLMASRHEFDPGCPAYIAQQFQQFQVLLQRYIENEPYEHGRRPEIYARMRISAPKLLQVPEYRDSEDEPKGEEGFNSRISSASFLIIMEDGIRTFMNFLKADREKNCQILTALFRRNRRGLVDPILLHLMKKANKKKKLKIRDLRRARKCIRKKRLTWEEEIEILLGLIDLKVVSRVLRMNEYITEEQLHWCEEKMGKVKVWEGKLQRDSSPLFFPAH